MTWRWEQPTAHACSDAISTFVHLLHYTVRTIPFQPPETSLNYDQ
jgi:hypothetical protein